MMSGGLILSILDCMMSFVRCAGSELFMNATRRAIN